MNGPVATGRAAGKVILFGEHAVVHGTAALACGLEVGMTARAEFVAGPLTLTVPNWDHRISTADEKSPHAEALRALCAVLSVRPVDVALTLSTALVPRAGLGASAALAASAARALCAYHDIDCDDETLFRAVQASERVYHGNPSGLDATLAIGGGLVRFSKIEGRQLLEIPPPSLIIVYSGEPGDTRQTVARVAKLLADSPVEGGRGIQAISDIVEAGQRALLARDMATLGELMVANHRILGRFGVSTHKLDDIVDIALEGGALGAKLTGGGGGGCAIVLPKEGDGGLVEKFVSSGYRVLSR